jgi:hypothetical protein
MQPMEINAYAHGGKPMKKVVFWSLLVIIYLLWPIALFRDSMWAQGVSLNWYLPLMTFAVLSPLWFLLIVTLRKRTGAMELHLLYLPLFAWIVSFFVLKFVSWALFKGKPVLWAYGRDKGLSNFLLAEPPLVCIMIAVVITLSILIPAKEQINTSAMKKRLLWLAMAASFLIALLIPPLPD